MVSGREKEKEENMWSEEKEKNRGGKGGKYLMKEKNREKKRKIFGEVKYMISGTEEKQRRKNVIFKKEKYLASGGEEKQKRKIF